ncbi:MAG: hypothetical protein AAFQ37_11875, partial [Bacteroidota bacterium]
VWLMVPTRSFYLRSWEPLLVVGGSLRAIAGLQGMLIPSIYRMQFRRLGRCALWLYRPKSAASKDKVVPA